MLLVRSGTVAMALVVCLSGCSMRQPAAVQPGAPSHSSSRATMGSTIESHDLALGAALLALNLAPSPQRHRAVAKEYRRLGIMDAAFDHLTAATRLDPRDAAAYDARARIWRDWGFPELGMADSARAVFFAPRSAAAHNTRGTLLAAAGLEAAARREFQAALSLDPNAGFARANLCRVGGC
jgi:tetratricopeptide (TPR) repeat protein